MGVHFRVFRDSEVAYMKENEDTFHLIVGQNDCNVYVLTFTLSVYNVSNRKYFIMQLVLK